MIRACLDFFGCLLPMPSLIALSHNIPWNKDSGRYNRQHVFHFIIAPQAAIATGEAGLLRTLQAASSLKTPPFIFLMTVSEAVMARMQETIGRFPAVSSLDGNDLCCVSIALQSHEYSIDNAIRQSAADSWSYGVRNGDVIGRFAARLDAQHKYHISPGLCLPDEYLDMVHCMEYQMQPREEPPFPVQDTRWTYTRLLVTSILLCLTIIGCIVGIPILVHAGRRYNKDRELAEAVRCSEKTEIPATAVDAIANLTAEEGQATGWTFSFRPKAASVVSEPAPNATDTLDNPGSTPGQRP